MNYRTKDCSNKMSRKYHCDKKRSALKCSQMLSFWCTTCVCSVVTPHYDYSLHLYCLISQNICGRRDFLLNYSDLLKDTIVGIYMLSKILSHTIIEGKFFSYEHLERKKGFKDESFSFFLNC